MAPQWWFDGVCLVGRFGFLKTGCWLLVHGHEAAVLEMPPAGWGEPTPAEAVQSALAGSPVRVTHLLCTHAHADHFSAATFHAFRAAFPDARPCLHVGFRRHIGSEYGVWYFDHEAELHLGGEPLHLVHAPKHSGTDTMVIFRGTACTGDWELGMLRSVHDWAGWGVPKDRKLESIARMEWWPAEKEYHIHRVYSVHANDRRDGVDFPALMAATRQEG
jgi:glyoxylase-like metal-dependent hydrolase (beta-lactamase superfamily II)